MFQNLVSLVSGDATVNGGHPPEIRPTLPADGDPFGCVFEVPHCLNATHLRSRGALAGSVGGLEVHLLESTA